MYAEGDEADTVYFIVRGSVGLRRATVARSVGRGGEEGQRPGCPVASVTLRPAIVLTASDSCVSQGPRGAEHPPHQCAVVLRRARGLGRAPNSSPHRRVHYPRNDRDGSASLGVPRPRPVAQQPSALRHVGKVGHRSKLAAQVVRAAAPRHRATFLWSNAHWRVRVSVRVTPPGTSFGRKRRVTLPKCHSRSWTTPKPSG